ncbi:hypothetical protein CR194_16505 [Salipaludibacillus keqinensis]|uniref:Uncharacterized protein n=1 Tax=Salipaludibacillus keqinensis TaxID=2045207 RepID=A0A323TAB8_9BACI|nr:hypothetical protein [Salipaludibacillus keqinensis]PYZ92428.1 hypothetical protein CR194_16505 [Salipaludibacillus keqinensis]
MHKLRAWFILITFLTVGCQGIESEELFEEDVRGQTLTFDISSGFFTLFVKDSSNDYLTFHSFQNIDSDYEVELYAISLTEDTKIFHPDFNTPQKYTDLPEDLIYHGDTMGISFKEEFTWVMQNKNSDYSDLYSFNPAYTAEEIHIQPMTLEDVKNLHAPNDANVSITVFHEDFQLSNAENELRSELNALRESREIHLSARDYYITARPFHSNYSRIEELDFSSFPTYLIVTKDGEMKTTGETEEVIQLLREFSKKKQD